MLCEIVYVWQENIKAQLGARPAPGCHRPFLFLEAEERKPVSSHLLLNFRLYESFEAIEKWVELCLCDLALKRHCTEDRLSTS
jgi:hypothetical protein